MTLTPRQETGAWTSDPGCPDAEALASYIDGRVTGAERALIEAHLANCEDCYLVFSETVQQQQAEQTTTWRSRYRWGARLAAGLAAAAGIFWAVESLKPAPDNRPATMTVIAALNELDAAGGSYRKFEPRLTVTLTHHDMEPTLRSVETTEPSPQRDAAQKALREAARKVEIAAKVNGAGVQGRQALAGMYFALGEAQPAAAVLEPDAQSSDAGLLSDLAATYLARRADGDVQRALSLLEHAVALDPKRAEAWFNLGLAAEAARQMVRAQEAWKQYLILDSSSEWATEARWHLGKVAERNRPPTVGR
jgi:tetratricopeptide (TPR) repeat protein